MKQKHLLRLFALTALGMGALGANAQSGQPHSVIADAQYATVDLSWKAPDESIKLQWHNDYAYNGYDGPQSDPQGPADFYTAVKFTAQDLKNYVGETVDSIYYYRYRNVPSVSVLIYENGKVVREQKVDISDFEKDTMYGVGLDEEYTIPEGAEVMFAMHYVAGINQEFVGICDKTVTPGKGNLVSTDGKTWTADSPGDFLITAILKNAATATPTGYNVYRDGARVNTEIIDSTAYELTGEADGTHIYKIGAQYADGSELLSYEVSATTTAPANLLAPASTFTGSVDELSGVLSWTAPLAVKDNELTWSNKVFNQAIGGTASSPKVWVKQDFDADDLLSAQGAQLSAVSVYLAQAVTGGKVFVMKNGVIDYYEDLSSETVAAFADSTWNKVTLAEPYKLEIGNTYSYGFYFTHAKGYHPFGVDAGTAVASKGNSFSTSSAKSSFADSKPTFKTLASGGITGNFMLSADLQGATETTAVPSYDVYCGETLLASDLTADSLEVSVDEPGTYSYTLVTKYDGKSAPEKSKNLTFTMPAAYAAPTIIDYNYADSTGVFDLEWSAEAVDLQHYGTATYMVGFDEEMTMLYGAKFSADELADYAGYQIKSLKFGVGEEIAFKLEILTGKGTRLYSQSFDKGDLKAQSLYTMTLDKPVTIPEGEDIYLAYNATLPAGSSPILIDNGPLVDGGAMVSLSDGAAWLKLGTINSTYNNYNIVIAAQAISAGPDATEMKAVELSEGKAVSIAEANKQILHAADVRAAAAEGFGVATATPAVAKAAKKAASRPKAKSFKVYRNGAVAEETAGTTYTETVTAPGVYKYYVTTIFENGWESPASRVITVEKTIDQNGAAPYALTGDYDESTLKLNWTKPAEGMKLTYYTGRDSTSLGLTSSSPEAYCAIAFTADTLAACAGKQITHISFGLASTELTEAFVFVAVGKGPSIVYKQDIALSDLKLGTNEVRLNTPFTITGDQDVYFGYFSAYPKGVKPHMIDVGPCTKSGYSDVISSSGSDGYWYSLLTKYKFDNNWDIAATLQTPDTTITAQKAPRKADAAAETYTVYRDGEVIATGLTEPAYDVAQALDGRYTVTATDAEGNESAPSNAVILKGSAASGISTVNATEAADVVAVYTLNGVQVAKSAKNLPTGVYLMKTADGKVVKVAK